MTNGMFHRFRQPRAALAAVRQCPIFSRWAIQDQLHRGLGTQSHRHARLLGVPFAAAGQFGFRPTRPSQHLSHQPFRLLFFRFLQLLTIMMLALLLPDHFQQFLPKTFRPPAPPPPQVLPLLSPLAHFEFLALLHAELQLPPATRVVRVHPPFTQHPIHSQPPRPFAGTLQILRKTAPAIVLQGLLPLQQPGPRRIQMHVITHRLEITLAVPLHDQRLIPPAKQVPKFFVPPIIAAGVGPQQPLHPGHQVGLGRLQHQVKVVAHQAIRVHLPAGLLTGRRQRLQQPLPVLVIPKDRLPPVAPIHHMIDRPWIFRASAGQPTC